MALVRRRVPDTVLLKVGAPAFQEARERNLQFCRELGVADAVRWVDLVSEDDLPLFYNAAAVLAFPSRYEGFGLPVLESLACGTPVVAFRVSSIPELVGEAVALVPEIAQEPFAEAIVAAIRAGKRNPNALVRQARQFTWERTVRGVQQSYRNAVDEHRRPRDAR